MNRVYDIVGPRQGRLLLVADHASNHVPAELADLGLPPAELARHIAIDIGTDGLARGVSQALDARAVICGFSRLLCDANRAEDAVDLAPVAADGADIPDNRDLDPAERAWRIERYHRPYHRAIAAELAAIEQPILIALHSFTPVMNGVERPWQIGLLYNEDERLADLAKDWLSRNTDLTVGDNQPYTGKRYNHTLDVHAQARGWPHLSLEVRQDLVGDAAGIAHWTTLLTRLIRHFLENRI